VNDCDYCVLLLLTIVCYYCCCCCAVRLCLDAGARKKQLTSHLFKCIQGTAAALFTTTTTTATQTTRSFSSRCTLKTRRFGLLRTVENSSTAAAATACFHCSPRSSLISNTNVCVSCVRVCVCVCVCVCVY
jgi:hypothetical protein